VSATDNPTEKLGNVVLSNTDIPFMKKLPMVSWVPVFTDDKNISDTLRVAVMYDK
jgi:hypothetical protein